MREQTTLSSPPEICHLDRSMTALRHAKWKDLLSFLAAILGNPCLAFDTWFGTIWNPMEPT